MRSVQSKKVAGERAGGNGFDVGAGNRDDAWLGVVQVVHDDDVWLMQRRQ